MIYIVLFIACCLLFFLENSKGTENLMKILQPVFVFVLILFIGLRQIGPDYESYHRIYNDPYHAKEIMETFFFYTMQFFNSRNIDFSLYMCFIAAISILIKVYVIKQNSPYFFLSIVIGLPLVFLGDMSQIRFALAVATILLAIPYCIDRNPWKFTLVILVASMMHISALILIVAYFLPSFRLQFGYMLLIWLACFIISFRLDNSMISEWVDTFVKDTMIDTKVDQYMNDDDQTYVRRVQYTLIGTGLKLFILATLCYSNIENQRLKSFFLNTYFIGGCLFYLFGFNEIIGGRLSLYYFSFEIISVPLALYYIKDKLLYWSLLLVFVGISFYQYYSMIYLQYDEMFLPYKSVISNFV